MYLRHTIYAKWFAKVRRNRQSTKFLLSFLLLDAFSELQGAGISLRVSQTGDIKAWRQVSHRDASVPVLQHQFVVCRRFARKVADCQSYVAVFLTFQVQPVGAVDQAQASLAHTCAFETIA